MSDFQALCLELLKAYPNRSASVEELAHSVARRRGQPSRRQYVLAVARAMYALHEQGIVSIYRSGDDRWAVLRVALRVYPKNAPAEGEG